MKDYSRKQRSDSQYRDLMRTTTSKEIFNDILEQTVGLGEFSNRKKHKSVLDKSVEQYLRQSEFKKPYNGLDFPEMENNWEGPPGLSPKGFDQPWNMQTPSDIIEATIFDAEHTGGWCEDYDTYIEITGTHPIYEVTVTWGTDVTISNISGYGTNLVSMTLHVPDPYSGFVTIEASMISSTGVIGDSNVNIYEKSECCAFSSTIHYVIKSGYLQHSTAQTSAASKQAAKDASWADLIAGPADFISVGTPYPEYIDSTLTSVYSYSVPLHKFSMSSSRVWASFGVGPASTVRVADLEFYGTNLSDPISSGDYIWYIYTGSDDSPGFTDWTEYSVPFTGLFEITDTVRRTTKYVEGITDAGISLINSGSKIMLLLLNEYEHNNTAPPGDAFGASIEIGECDTPPEHTYIMHLLYKC